MKKKEFAKHLIQTIDNARELDGLSDDQVVEVVECLLGLLEPKDKERFAKWGTPEKQVDIKDCWD